MSRLGVLRVVIALGLGVPMFSTAVQAGAASQDDQPGMVTSSEVAGQALPSLVWGSGWTQSSTGWQTSFRAIAPPGGSTTVVITWRTRPIQIRAGQKYFHANFTITHQGVPNSLETIEKVRTCPARGSCHAAWASLPFFQAQALEAPPLIVSTETGAGPMTWKGSRAQIRVEWQLTEIQTTLDETTTQVSLSR